MKIGIGVTTYNRPGHIVIWKEQLHEHAPKDEHVIYIAADSKNRLGLLPGKMNV